jgi:hypothetical protein
MIESTQQAHERDVRRRTSVMGGVIRRGDVSEWQVGVQVRRIVDVRCIARRDTSSCAPVRTFREGQSLDEMANDLLHSDLPNSRGDF